MKLTHNMILIFMNKINLLVDTSVLAIFEYLRQALKMGWRQDGKIIKQKNEY